jgi:glycosyl transferase family 9 (putative heptosyltransferase)
VSRRCLVVHPGALGDVLLAGPALAHLRALGYCPTLAVTFRLLALFEASGLVDVAVDLETLALHHLFVEAPHPEALRALTTFDAVVCWIGAGDAAFRTNLARIGRPTVVARAAPPPGSGRHVSRHLLETLAPLGPAPADLPVAPLRVSEAARTTARTWLFARGIAAGEAIVLQPGAGSPAKVWPGFSALARRLREGGLPLVTLVGPADYAAVQTLLDAGAVREDTLARDWPLPEIAALLGLARATVGNDSGPTHLAAAVGCPTVALFGPTDPDMWSPVGPRVQALDGRAEGAAWPGIDRVEATLRDLRAPPAGGELNAPVHAAAGDAWR